MPEVYTGDLRELVVEKWTTLTPTTVVYVYCPKHNDTLRKSMAVYPDHCYCFTCEARLNRAEFSALFSSQDLTSAKMLAGTLTRKPTPASTINVQAIAGAAYRLLAANADKRDWLLQRGITRASMERFKLGHYGTAYTLPVFDRSGNIHTIRFRRDDIEAPEAPKYWGVRGINSTLLYPQWPATQRVLVMTEGEFDTLVLQQEGLPSFSLTNGCRSGENLEEWVELLRSTERLILCRDQDVPGREATEKLCERLYQRFPGLDLQVVTWEGHTKDVTELWQYDPSRYQTVVKLLHQLVDEVPYAATA